MVFLNYKYITVIKSQEKVFLECHGYFALYKMNDMKISLLLDRGLISEQKLLRSIFLRNKG